MLQQLQIDCRAGAVILPFTPRRQQGGFTVRDRMDISLWREHVRAQGCDRMVVHERTHTDPPEIESFLSIYRAGQAWASWSLARSGSCVLAWCSVTGTDIGRFASVADALATLFPGAGVGTPRNRMTAQIIPVFC